MAKVKLEYDEWGFWVQERMRVESAFRKSFRLSPQIKEIKDAARVELPPLPRKDGSDGKRVRVRYKCAMCGKLYTDKQIEIDHIEPVKPVHIDFSKLPREEWVVMLLRRLFCSSDNLQVLCKIKKQDNNGVLSCHRKKTNEENFIRRQFNKLNRTILDHEVAEYTEKFKKEFIEHESQTSPKKKKKCGNIK